jgi:hypothetical protein
MIARCGKQVARPDNFARQAPRSDTRGSLVLLPSRPSNVAGLGGRWVEDGMWNVEGGRWEVGGGRITRAVRFAPISLKKSVRISVSGGRAVADERLLPLGRPGPWSARQELCQLPEVLGGGREVELVPGAVRAAQS